MNLLKNLSIFLKFILVLSFFGFVSSWISLPGWQFLCGSVLLVWIFPRFRQQILLTASLTFAVFFFSFQDWTLRAVNHFSDKNIIDVVKIGSLIFSYAFSYMLITKFKWGFFGKQSHFKLFFIFNFLTLTSVYWGAQYPIKYLLLIFSHYIIFVALVINEQNTTNYRFKLLDFAFLRPIWTSNRVFPRISNFGDLAHAKVNSIQDFEPLVLKSAHLIAQSSVLLVFCDFLFYLKFGQFEYLRFLSIKLPSLNIERSTLSLRQVNLMNLSIMQTWGVMALTYSIYLLKVTYWGNLYVAVARMVGYPIYRMAYRPWEAKSLNDFFRRIHFYYYEIIKLLFFYPLLKTLKFKNLKLKLFFATLLSIFIGGGLQFHLFGFPDVVFRNSLTEVFWAWAPAGIYHVLFGVMLGFSIIREVHDRRYNVKKKPLFFSARGIIIFCTYLWVLSWIIAWGPEWPKPDFQDQIRFSFKMIGLKL